MDHCRWGVCLDLTTEGFRDWHPESLQPNNQTAYGLAQVQRDLAAAVSKLKGEPMAITDTHITVEVEPAKGSGGTIPIKWSVPKDVAAHFKLKPYQRITSEKSQEIRRFKEKQERGAK
jgi:hypothetical protein